MLYYGRGLGLIPQVNMIAHKRIQSAPYIKQLESDLGSWIRGKYEPVARVGELEWKLLGRVGKDHSSTLRPMVKVLAVLDYLGHHAKVTCGRLLWSVSQFYVYAPLTACLTIWFWWNWTSILELIPVMRSCFWQSSRRFLRLLFFTQSGRTLVLVGVWVFLWSLIKVNSLGQTRNWYDLIDDFKKKQVSLILALLSTSAMIVAVLVMYFY